jgi:alpha-beta hydrolase superfamily lysophospholipase
VALGFSSHGKGKPSRTPADFGVKYETVHFKSAVDNVGLCGWYLRGGGDTTVIVMHGGRAHREDSHMGLLELCAALAKKGFNVLDIDRRNCGHSGTPRIGDRARLERDMEGAVNYVKSRNGDGHNIFLFGNSVGAIAALIYTYEHRGDSVRGIIADSAFESKRGIARRLMNGGFPGAEIFAYGSLFAGEILFGLSRLDAIDVVAGIPCPILFAAGDGDKQIPVSAVELLLKKSANPEDELLVIAGAAHSRTSRTDPENYVKKVVGFLNRHRN